RLRHSASHVLATAILKIWPEAQLAAGPPVENGFYYDVDLPHRISPDDFEKIEAEMKKEIKANRPFERVEVSRDEALELGKKGRLAALIEEAKKRDHRKLGRELELFVFDDDVGPGLPMFLPRGAVIAEELEKLAKETEFGAGYQRVRTPHIARESMYKKSGHLPYYEDSMFPPMILIEGADEQRHRELYRDLLVRRGSSAFLNSEDPLHELEMSNIAELESEMRALGTKYYLKAMNCPHHHKLFAAVPRSYRDLPLRLAEYGTCYRYEQSGELFGLMRVRSLQMNDAHLYMTPEQFEAEFNAVNEMYLNYFKLFGIDKYLMRFSTHDPSALGQKFVDEPELWKKTEEMTRNVLKNSGINYVEVPNEAAFYGPKIDVQAWSVIGREFSIATNQVDFSQPRNFDLRYKDRDNVDKIPICIHR